MKQINSVSTQADIKRNKYFPIKIVNNITVEAASKEEVNTIIRKYYNKVFSGGFKNQVSIKPTSKNGLGIISTRIEYEKIHHENFLIKDNGKPVGWISGEMEDFETFYMRNTGILPSHRNRKIYTKFLSVFLKYMNDIGYQRISSHHASWDAAIIRSKMKQGFVIVGTENSDRWGSLTKLVKFLDPKREKKFKTLF